MGWTSKNADYYKPNGQVDRKAECDNLLNWENENWKTETIKSQMVGSVYYAAVKRTDKKSGHHEVTAAVILTHGKDRRDPYFNFGYKEMCETCGPGECKCPKSILDLLTPTESEWANEWRQRCRENLKKIPLSKLPVGTEIKINYFGNEVYLTKMAPNYQFKRNWWYNPENNTYMPSRRIPDDYEIVKGE